MSTIKTYFWNCLVVLIALASSAWGATPLLTDDTATLGPGKVQLEVCGRWGTDRDTTDGLGAVLNQVFAFNFR